MQLHFSSVLPSNRFLAGFRRLGVALILVVVGVFAHGAKGQGVENRPVARLITSETSYSRPGRVQPAVPEVKISSSAVAAASLDQANPIERRVFEKTNLERLRNGLPPFTWDGDLSRMARSHSENMARTGYIAHQTPEGSRLRERARAVGIAHYTVLGENIAYNLGYDDPGGFAVERWMLSPKHRANILYTGFKAMAVGTFVAADGSVFLTQTFIAR
jgi:uncharacterized protein YkwD